MCRSLTLLPKDERDAFAAEISGVGRFLRLRDCALPKMGRSALGAPGPCRRRLVAARRLTAPAATYYEMRRHTFPKRRGGRCPSAQAARRAPV